MAEFDKKNAPLKTASLSDAQISQALDSAIENLSDGPDLDALRVIQAFPENARRLVPALFKIYYKLESEIVEHSKPCGEIVEQSELDLNQAISQSVNVDEPCGFEMDEPTVEELDQHEQDLQELEDETTRQEEQKRQLTHALGFIISVDPKSYKQELFTRLIDDSAFVTEAALTLIREYRLATSADASILAQCIDQMVEQIDARKPLQDQIMLISAGESGFLPTDDDERRFGLSIVEQACSILSSLGPSARVAIESLKVGVLTFTDQRSMHCANSLCILTADNPEQTVHFFMDNISGIDERDILCARQLGQMKELAKSAVPKLLAHIISTTARANGGENHWTAVHRAEMQQTCLESILAIGQKDPAILPTVRNLLVRESIDTSVYGAALALAAKLGEPRSEVYRMLRVHYRRWNLSHDKALEDRGKENAGSDWRLVYNAGYLASALAHCAEESFALNALLSELCSSPVAEVRKRAYEESLSALPLSLAAELLRNLAATEKSEWALSHAISSFAVHGDSAIPILEDLAKNPSATSILKAECEHTVNILRGESQQH